MILNSGIRMVLSDLDGTLFDESHQISSQDLQTLHNLGKQGVIRVAATGRTFYRVNKVLEADFPVDFVIFSSGAGVIDWKSKEIIYAQSIDKETVRSISEILVSENLSFMLLNPIPENHKYVYHQTKKETSDFTYRNKIYDQYASPIHAQSFEFREASQFLIIFDQADLIGFNNLKLKLLNTKVIRATSPLDGKSIWMELFPAHVSKGETAAWLCKRLEINKEETFAIGNDYNDVDLLKFAEHSFVVANAPDELKKKYKVTGSVYESGFSMAITLLFRK